MSIAATMKTHETTPIANLPSESMIAVARRQRLQDALFHRLTQFFSLLVLIALMGIIVSLFINAWPTFAKFGARFLWYVEWDIVNEEFGAAIAVVGTLVSATIALLIAMPLSFGVALFLTETCPVWLRRPLGTAVELLAAVPSIIYGMLGLAIFVRTLEPLTSGALFGAGDPGTANGRTILSAGWTLALLVLPLIIINAQEAIRSVSASLRQASYGLGATRWQLLCHAIVPAALPDILVGLRIAMGFAWTTLVAAEMVAATQGLGQMVLNASNFLRTDIVVMGIFVIGTIALLLDALLRRLERWLLPWHGR